MEVTSNTTTGLFMLTRQARTQPWEDLQGLSPTQNFPNIKNTIFKNTLYSLPSSKIDVLLCKALSKKNTGYAPDRL